MFDAVRQLKNARLSLSSKRSLTESDIDQAIRDIRLSLLEADVEFGVVKSFLASVKEKALGEIVQLEAGQKNKRKSVRPGDHFTYICLKELEALMGPQDTDLIGNKSISIMMVGLQGSGKTMTKASWRASSRRRGVYVAVAADIYRPAAVEQLSHAGGVGVPVFHELAQTRHPVREGPARGA